MSEPRDGVGRAVAFLPDLDARRRPTLAERLERGGMPAVPCEFAVVAAGQCIGRDLLDDILTFVGVFDSVTSRTAWIRAVTGGDAGRPETCFFSAWDFHLPPDRPEQWQLIEFNDNGSGFLFAALVNRCFYEVAGLDSDRSIEAPPDGAAFEECVRALIAREAERFFGKIPSGLFFILDDPVSLREGKFRREHLLLREVLRRWGVECEIGSADTLDWSGAALRHRGMPVSFVVNRSTDFSWADSAFAAVRAAYASRAVYVAPNPFTYDTRSDKRLLQYLSLPDWDDELGITPQERSVLARHVPETHVLTAENAGELAARKSEFVFKPMHGFAGRGLLTAESVGESRLRRLLRKDRHYVAQKIAPKSVMRGAGGRALWTDLRIWAYRGERWQMSGRASTRPDRLALDPPGGWIPTYARR